MSIRSSRPEFVPLLEVLSRVRSGLAVLLALTVVLLTWHHYGMERVVTLTPANTPTEADTDAETGGGSVARLERDGSAARVHCHTVPKHEWPYCRLRMRLGTVPNGMDLTRFDYMSLDMSIEGGGVHAMRAELIDFEHGISTVDVWDSMKVNEIESFPVPANGVVNISMNLFYAATWWKNKVKRPLEQTGVRMDNVVSIDLLTDADNRQVDQVITLRAIRFHGKWISTTTMLVILVGAWMLAAIGWPLMAALTLGRQLSTKDAELALLSEVNKALQLEAKDLVGQAHTDPLTGLLNRQGLRAALISTSSMLTHPMCVVFMDIDHFKRVNDTHGHDIGDDVLRRFAEAIRTNIRASDKLVRWGGEEFLLVCSNTGLAQAAALAEKLRLGLRQQAWPLGLHITSSFGIAEQHAEEEFSDVIKRADHALYAAKADGRDRVHADGLTERVQDNAIPALQA